MSNQDAAFGLRPSQNEHKLAATKSVSYCLWIWYGYFPRRPSYTSLPMEQSLVLQLVTTNLILGVFNGCSYVDPSGDIIYSNYWPANATGTDIFANVIDDPSATFEIQADAAFPVADLFGNFDIVDATAGSTVSGNSRTELDVTTGATTAGLALKAIDISQDPENSDVSSANTNVIVKINNHLFSAGTAGLA